MWCRSGGGAAGVSTDQRQFDGRRHGGPELRRLTGNLCAGYAEPIAGLAIKQWDFGREHIAPYLPSEASQAVINTALASADDVRLSWWGGAVTLVVWAAVFAGVGIVRVVRQDIS